MSAVSFGKLVAASSLSLLLALPVAAQSLSDTMVAAYRNSPLIDQNRAVLRAADEDVAQAIATLRPVLDWSLSHSLSSGGTNVSTLGLQAQMTLYDWGRSQLAIDRTKELVLATRESLVGVEQEVLLESVRAFFDVRSSAEQVDLQQNSVRLLGQEQQAAQDRFDVGEITSTDVSLANAQLAASRASLAAAQGNLEIAREGYRAATGGAPGNLAAPPPLPRLPESLAAARAIGQRNHPNMKQAQHQAAAAELGVAAAKAERNPRLTGQLRAGIARQPQPGAPDNYVTGRNAEASVELSQRILFRRCAVLANASADGGARRGAGIAAERRAAD